MAEIKVAPLDWKPITEQCPRCYGRGYKPEKRRPSKANPHANGFYARTCPRCNGTGQSLIAGQQLVERESNEAKMDEGL